MIRLTSIGRSRRPDRPRRRVRVPEFAFVRTCEVTQRVAANR
jgi:hypothetical protein